MPDDKCNSFAQYVPFVGLMMGKVGQTPMFARLAEAAVMSLVAGAFALYVGVEVIKVEIRNIEYQIQQVDKKVESVDSKVEKIKSDLYIPNLPRDSSHVDERAFKSRV